jgi:hypothetical protein
VTFAHVAGLPVEETLGAVAPVAVVMAAALRATIHRVRKGGRG